MFVFKLFVCTIIHLTSISGMNSAVRAVVRMGFYLGCKTYYIREVQYKCLFSASLFVLCL